MKFRALASLSVLGLVAALHAGASLLPELETHRQFALSSLSSGNGHAVHAACDVLASHNMSYRLPSSSNPIARQAFVEAVAQWERTLDARSLFVEAFSFQDPHIEIKYEAKLGTDSKPFGGYTSWKRQIVKTAKGAYEARLDATMQLRTHTPSGKPMNLHQLRHAAMHELGHLLGLDDSATVGDVMGPLDLHNPVYEPTRDEIRELKKLRSDASALRARAEKLPKV